MYTGNYDFAVVNAVKIIVKNDRGEILLIQEPETNAWMPLHWGLPGGKSTEKESILETFHRKANTDLGQNLKLEGLLKIEELLIDKRTVIMFIVLATSASDSINGEIGEYKWVDKNVIEKMRADEFTEYYNKELLLNYFDNKLKLVPLDIFKTWKYFDMGNDEGYINWLNSGKKE